MTISPERIEAEIAAEVKCIEAWNDSEPYPESGMAGHPLFSSQVISLANHLCRNRLQVEDAQVKALVVALKGTADGDYPEGDLVPCWCHFRDHEDFCLQARAALAPFKEVTP